MMKKMESQPHDAADCSMIAALTLLVYLAPFAGAQCMHDDFSDIIDGDENQSEMEPRDNSLNPSILI